MIKQSLTSILALVLVLFAQTTRGWDDSGHRTVAQIAKDALKDDPEAAKALADVLQADPRHRSLYEASKWPDVLKSESPQGATFDSKQHVNIDAHWHFVDIPYDATAEEMAAIINDNGAIPDPTKQDTANVVTAIRYYVAQLKDLKNSPAPEAALKRADAVSWLIHLVGDIHQPLHCTTVLHALPGYNPSALHHKDIGGNGMMILWPVKSWKKYQDNLHSFWDDQLDLDKELNDSDIPATATTIESEHGKDSLAEQLKLADPENWAKESFAFHEKAYNTPYMKKPSTEYQDWVKQVAHLRLALAGYRLASLLEDVLK